MGAPAPVAMPTLKSVITWKRQGDATVDQINFWSYSGGAPSAADLANFALDLCGAAATEFTSLCDTFTGVVSATVTDISVDPVVQGENATPFVGTRSGALLPPATAAVVNTKPANPYRGGKPKNFLPFGTGGDVADTGLWASAFVTEVNLAWAAFVDDMIGDVRGSTTITNPVLVSYYHGGSIVTISPTTGRARNTPKKRGVNYSTTPPSGTWTPVQLALRGSACSDKIGSQRRRNRNA